MKVLLHYPEWHNRWEPYIINALSDYDLTISHTEEPQKLGDLSLNNDVLINMWANLITEFWTHEFPEKKIITYLRRYEIWQPTLMCETDWSVVNKAIFVSKWCQDAANMMWSQGNIVPPADQTVIHNGIDFNDFQFRPKKTGTKKIALVCSMKEVKNVPLAMQILLELPKEYEIHHIGLPFTTRDIGQNLSYMHGLGLTDRFHSDGFIEREKVGEWLKDKDFILSTSLNEGNPNNIVEAMAMGIKPVIHAWPGARDQFPNDLVFDRISGAIDIITGKHYDPRSYRDWVLSRYSLDNFNKFKNVVDSVINC